LSFHVTLVDPPRISDHFL